ncbi:hypothetical protein C4K34_2677 [Pseudomonas chlororaphis subsp. piscium]|nr:hypothetical protein C4K34_2677 [Pseudomonas chlororaphis subsp. piscium]AZC63068.1 hypothetical protein C4K33_2576 [Pseudomonas chlororaphis subsp. piscium]AZC69299.1 hypothetical protein C4K32_2637 [Pseudomonas chlororaphis subsp. piscium]AZC75477.1 hypothetical protein C4K31_2574 [Pseudomonas chlororaphis subsp. piscium]AZC88954.1 hypothetical protein C4K29_2653 [Pseudomonas chlororaphis subsp. piscium]
MSCPDIKAHIRADAHDFHRGLNRSLNGTLAPGRNTRFWPFSAGHGDGA